MSRRSKTKSWGALIGTAAMLFFASCAEIQRPQPEPFYSETTPPAKQEFRWSNGKLPRSFDPARAAAAPETDVVRALFEGLTEVDPRTFEAIPAAAEKWSASDDQRTWTFQLRKGARWSNGKRVTSYDFVSSWKRLVALGDKTAHRELFQNIVGFRAAKPIPNVEPPDLTHLTPVSPQEQSRSEPANSAPHPAQDGSDPLPSNTATKKAEVKHPNSRLGVEAIDDLTLQVSLVAPDPDLPKLVAHPIFRPIYGDGSEFAEDLLDNGVVTNGAFQVALVDKNGISLDRSETYWDKQAVKLEHVRFVAKDSAESALEAYKKGEIDALTNANFEPLALKLLAPYDDFRQTTFSAVNLYKFDDTRPPYNDRRVREALAVAIDRERLCTTELEGATDPANSFLPTDGESTTKLVFDPARARKLLEAAGFPDSQGLAPIKIVINRNDTQMRVARAVARMWKQALNLDTEVSVKETSELAAAESSHEFDIVRHGFVLPTADERVSLAAIFGDHEDNDPTSAAQPATDQMPAGKAEKGGPLDPLLDKPAEKPRPVALTEEDALFELNAIPLYFPRSYSLVKPYVRGFDINGLDAVYLPGVSVDSDWRPKEPVHGS